MDKMICGNTQAEIDHDLAQSEFERSTEHRAATLALKDKRHEFISALLKNNYYTVGQNTYTLRDAIESIQDDAFWNEIVFSSCGVDNTVLYLFTEIDDEDFIQNWYASGNMSKWHPEILKQVESLADNAIGELNE